MTITILPTRAICGCGVPIMKHTVRGHDLVCPPNGGETTMTPKQRAKEHRKRERMHAREARYCIRHGMYVEALRSVAWAIQQEAAAEAAEREGTR